MATNDFIVDIVEKLQEDNLEYLLVYIQKGKDEHHANAYYHVVSPDAADMIAATVSEVYKEIDENESTWPDDSREDFEDPNEDEQNS